MESVREKEIMKDEVVERILSRGPSREELMIILCFYHGKHLSKAINIAEKKEWDNA